MLSTFERYVRHQHFSDRVRWPKLLMKITDLRTVAVAYAERTLTIKLESPQTLPRVFQTLFSDEQPPPPNFQPPPPPPLPPPLPSASSSVSSFLWASIEQNPDPSSSLSCVLGPAEVQPLAGPSVEEEQGSGGGPLAFS